MLHVLITANHRELIDRCREKASRRLGPAGTTVAVDHGLAVFLRQLANTLHEEATAAPADPGQAKTSPSAPEMARAAAAFGTGLLGQGLRIDEVVRHYGDVCQSLTDLALERSAAISVREFRTLNGCLDDAIADAVTAFFRSRRDRIVDQDRAQDSALDEFQEEHVRLVTIALQALAALRTGNVGLFGATGTLLDHALNELQSLAARGLPRLRTASDPEPAP